MSQTKLNEYDKTEWQDVAKMMMPGLTDEEYEAMWVEFCELKAEHLRKKELQ